MSVRSRWSRIPLACALADLRRERTRGTVALYVAIAATMILLASVPVCGRVQDQFGIEHTTLQVDHETRRGLIDIEPAPATASHPIE